MLETYGRDSDRRFELHLALCLRQLTGASWSVPGHRYPYSDAQHGAAWRVTSGGK
jgi:hypothetical protein